MSCRARLAKVIQGQESLSSAQSNITRQINRLLKAGQGVARRVRSQHHGPPARRCVRCASPGRVVRQRPRAGGSKVLAVSPMPASRVRHPWQAGRFRRRAWKRYPWYTFYLFLAPWLVVGFLMLTVCADGRESDRQLHELGRPMGDARPLGRPGQLHDGAERSGHAAQPAADPDLYRHHGVGGRGREPGAWRCSSTSPAGV